MEECIFMHIRHYSAHVYLRRLFNIGIVAFYSSVLTFVLFMFEIVLFSCAHFVWGVWEHEFQYDK